MTRIDVVGERKALKSEVSLGNGVFYSARCRERLRSTSQNCPFLWLTRKTNHLISKLLCENESESPRAGLPGAALRIAKVAGA
jgi:hypothetical protein